MNSIEAAQAVDSAGEFVTLPSDLEGFWAMVMLQVDDVQAMISSCDHLRQNGWQIPPDSSIYNGKKGSSSSTVRSSSFLYLFFCLFHLQWFFLLAAFTYETTSSKAGKRTLSSEISSE